MLAWMSNVRLPMDAGDFGLLSRCALDALRSTPERHGYVRGLRRWIGFRQLGIGVERDERAGGTSKHSARKLLRVAFDGNFSFSTVPLRAATVIGAAAMALCVAYAAYAVAQKLARGRAPLNYALYRLWRAEYQTLGRARVPFGSSLLVVARPTGSGL